MINNNNILLQQPSVLEYMEQQLREQGFSGSADLPKLVYLTATSRILSEPISLVVMGPSGAGKTYGIDSVLQFIPDDQIENVSGMSDKALLYLNGLSLKHRVLYLGEAAGMAEGNGRTFLRQFLSEGNLSYLTVTKTPSGMKGERLSPVEGPISLIMATTENRLHDEDQSRMLQLNIEEGQDRIREALINQARGISKGHVKLDLAPWHELQRYLAQTKFKVHIPYAEEIAMHVPINTMKIQRDFPKLLNAIKCNAMLNFNKRDGEDGNTLIANEDDYREVYRVLNKTLSDGMERSVRESVRSVVEAVSAYERTAHSGSVGGISHSKLAEIMKMDRSVVGRNIRSAVSKGFLIDNNPGQGREARVVTGDRKLPEGNALPSPEALFSPAPVSSIWLQLASA